MRIAVFQSTDEILVFQVKGTKKDASSIDGFDHYFAPDMGRGIKEYDVRLAHLGSGECLCISTKLVGEIYGRSQDIGEWFPELVAHYNGEDWPPEEPGDTRVTDVDPHDVDDLV